MNEPTRLLRFAGAVARAAAIDRWFDQQPPDLAALGRPWFDFMRARGPDVRELLHDGHPTACVGDAAFGYVNVFTAHVNVGFFLGALLPDPAGLLEGTGKRMRHVKLRPTPGAPAAASSGADSEARRAALAALIEAAYRDIRARLQAGVG